MLGVCFLLFLFGSCLCKPVVHSSVHAEFKRFKREQDVGGDPVTLLITFKSVDLSAASKPQLLLQEVRKRLPMFMAVDAEEWVSRPELYQRHRGEYVYRRCKEVHESSRAFLSSLGVSIIEDFVVSNSFLIEDVDEEIVNILSQREDVVEV